MMLALPAFRSVFFLFVLICAPLCVYSDNCEVIENGVIDQGKGVVDKLLKKSKKHKKLSYYLFTEDFIQNFIQIPTANVLANSSTLSSSYLAGRAAIYNNQDEKVGTCSASFLCMQNEDGIFTDISNYLTVDNGLVISWFTPTTLINLELDSILHSMVTECIVKASTKIGFNPFYGKTFNMIVSSDDKKIYFDLTEL